MCCLYLWDVIIDPLAPNIDKLIKKYTPTNAWFIVRFGLVLYISPKFNSVLHLPLPSCATTPYFCSFTASFFNTVSSVTGTKSPNYPQKKNRFSPSRGTELWYCLIQTGTTSVANRFGPLLWTVVCGNLSRLLLWVQTKLKCLKVQTKWGGGKVP